MPEPVKRNEALKPLSREHHHGLLLCWKIRTGLKLNIQPERIKKYATWFWSTNLKHHFEIEEKYVFPVLGNENKLIIQATKEHTLLKSLFEDETDITGSLQQIESELDKHIRFEERVLFAEVQRAASREELDRISRAHTSDLNDNWPDEFWVNNDRNKQV